jgi:hypothetical protein
MYFDGPLAQLTSMWQPEIKLHLVRVSPPKQMLLRIEPRDYMSCPMSHVRSVCKFLEDRKQAQHASLIALLEGGPIDESAAIADATVPIVESALASWVSTEGTSLSVDRLTLVSKGWTVAVRLWLRTEMAKGFWQRFLATLLPTKCVRHPELASVGMLLHWLKMPMAAGSWGDWLRCGRGMAENDEQGEAKTELELAIELSQLFALWCNVAARDCPRDLGWMRLYFEPWLDGEKHATDGLAEEARPTWDLRGGVRIPHSLPANICDCIKDFCGCPMVTTPDHVDEWLHCLLRGVMAYVGLPSPGEHGAVPDGLPKQWRFMWVTAAQNNTMFALLRRFAPLFPQREDRAEHVPVEAVWKGRRGKRPDPNDNPRAPLLESQFNEFLCIDKSNTDREQEYWMWYMPRPDLSSLPPEVAAMFAAHGFGEEEEEESEEGEASEEESEESEESEEGEEGDDEDDEDGDVEGSEEDEVQEAGTQDLS